MDDALKKYIERALRLANERDTVLDEGDLADIAREIGLTGEDLARVEQAIDDHLDRGRGYADHGMWDDAVRELEEAAAIAPTRTDVQLALASALAERSSPDMPLDRRRAEELARAVIAREPKNGEAFAILARLNPTRAPTTSKQPQTADDEPAKARRAILVGVLTGIAGLLACGAYFFMPSERVDTPPVEPPDTPRVVDDVAEFESGEVDLPVEFESPELMSLTARRSRLATYPSSAFYTLWGDIEVIGDAEIEEIQGRVTLLDDNGEPLKVYDRDLWASHEAILRKDDHGIFTLLLEADPSAKRVRVETRLIKRVPAKGPYEEAEVIEPDFRVTPPAHLKVEFAERTASFGTGVIPNRGTFEATWEVRNVGTTPIRELTYTVELYDDAGELLESKRRLATFSSRPPIAPGEVRLESTISILEATNFARYELVVTEIE